MRSKVTIHRPDPERLAGSAGVAGCCGVTSTPWRSGSKWTARLDTKRPLFPTGSGMVDSFA